MSDPIDSLALLAHVEKLVEAKINAHHEKLQHSLDKIASRLASLEQLLKDGFPEGDLAAHRRVHEGYIADATERDKMLRGAKSKIVEMSAWSAVVIVAMALWDYFRAAR